MKKRLSIRSKFDFFHPAVLMSFFLGMLSLGIAFSLPAHSAVVEMAVEAPESGPFFHVRSPVRVGSYTKRETKAVSRMSEAERASLGIVLEDGIYKDAQGRTISAGAQRKVTVPGSSYSSDSAHVGRFLYLGTAPRFGVDELELYVSKVTLSLRAKGWVSEKLITDYRYTLLSRWKRIYDDFQDPVLRFHPLKDPASVRDGLKDASLKAWMEIALQYMRHILDSAGAEFYSPSLDDGEYKKRVLLATLRHYTNDPEMTLEAGLALQERLSRARQEGNLEVLAQDAEASRELFFVHLGDWFTPDLSREDYEGFVTFVYPIAGSTRGPFDIPAEQVIGFGSRGTFIEARSWSDIWKTEFGGMPFLEVVNGVGFHGPITSKSGLDAWFLRRGYVSHGCFRMDASDVQEFRAILPDFKSLKGKGVPLRITAWPDVTDWNNDGRLEAIDVAYYEIPTSVNAKNVSNYLFPNVRKRYWERHFKSLDGKLKDENGEKIAFDLETGVFNFLPNYEFEGSRVKRVGFHREVPVHVFPSRPTAIIQYQDTSVSYNSGAYEDNRGKYPPKRYNDWTLPVGAQ